MVLRRVSTLNLLFTLLPVIQYRVAGQTTPISSPTQELSVSSYTLMEPTPSVIKGDNGSSSVLPKMHIIIIILACVVGALLCVLFTIITGVLIVARRRAHPRNKHAESVRQTSLHLPGRNIIPLQSNLCYGTGNLPGHEDEGAHNQHLSSSSAHPSLYYSSTDVLSNQRNQILGSESDHIYDDIVNYPIQRNSHSDKLPPNTSECGDDSSRRVYENSTQSLIPQNDSPATPPHNDIRCSVESDGYVNDGDGPPTSRKYMYANIDSVTVATSHATLPCAPPSMNGSQDYEIPVEQSLHHNHNGEHSKQ